jgi:hypothetical protein
VQERDVTESSRIGSEPPDWNIPGFLVLCASACCSCIHFDIEKAPQPEIIYLHRLSGVGVTSRRTQGSVTREREPVRDHVTTQKSELGKWWWQQGITAWHNFVGSNTARLALSPCPYLLFESTYRQVQVQTLVSKGKTTHQKQCDEQETAPSNQPTNNESSASSPKSPLK